MVKQNIAMAWSSRLKDSAILAAGDDQSNVWLFSPNNQDKAMEMTLIAKLNLESFKGDLISKLAWCPNLLSLTASMENWLAVAGSSGMVTLCKYCGEESEFIEVKTLLPPDHRFPLILQWKLIVGILLLRKI